MNETDNNDVIFERAYFKWLIHSNQLDKDKVYNFLLRRLWQKHFYFLIENDGNRSSDGIYLRYLYSVSWDQNYDVLNQKFSTCRVLEMLIALSKKGISNISYTKTGLLVNGLFWMMLENVGLGIFNDDFCGKLDDPVGQIDHVLNKFLDRKYDKFGNGGLFPLKMSQKNQRENELWCQLNEYIIENQLF